MLISKLLHSYNKSPKNGVLHFITVLYLKVFNLCFVKTLLQLFSDFVISRKFCVVDTLGFSHSFLEV
jgi:hypothetical protein